MRPTSVHDARDAELAALISQVRGDVRNIYGATKTFMRLRALGVRTSRKRVARIMRDNGWRGATRACAKRASGEKRACARFSPRTWWGAISRQRDQIGRGSPTSPT